MRAPAAEGRLTPVGRAGRVQSDRERILRVGVSEGEGGESKRLVGRCTQAREELGTGPGGPPAHSEL